MKLSYLGMINSKKYRHILMIAPLPPPVHGSAMMTQYIKDSKLINDSICLDWVNLSTSRRMDEIGKTTPIKLWRFINSYILTFWKLATHRYDACYLAITCHGAGFLKDAPFALLCKLFRRRIIIHQHNKGMAKDVDRPVFRWLLPMVYRNAKVILLSWRLYPDIEKVVKKEQVTICPNGIPEVKRLPKSTNDIPRLLFLSNLLESKGVFVLLDACKILKEKGYVFECRFVGGETKEINRERFEQEVRLRGLDEIIVYAGRKYGDDKNREFSQSDIFVLPTFNECFPLVLLESEQQGLPIVSTPIGGIPDIIEDNVSGLLTETHNPTDLAQKLEKLIRDPKLRNIIGENGYQQFMEHYTLGEFEKSILSALKYVKLGGVNS